MSKKDYLNIFYPIALVLAASLLLSVMTIEGKYYYLIVSIIVVGALVVAMARIEKQWKALSDYTLKFILAVVMFICMIVAARAILFYNPYAMRFYLKHGTSDDFGWRQLSLLHYKAFQEKTDVKRCRYLAIGSSQVGAMFRVFPRAFDLFGLVGLLPSEYGFYEQYVMKKHPRYIFLYLSEIDFAKKNEPGRLLVNAENLSHSIKIFMVVNRHDYGQINIRNIMRRIGYIIAVNYIIPEHKNGYIFRGLVHNFLRYNEVFSIESNTLVGKGSVILEAQKYGLLALNSDENQIETNMELFEDFVSFCKKQDIRVIILEGGFSQILWTEDNKRMHEKVLAGLSEITKRNHNVIVVPKTEIYEIQPSDYSAYDAVHVDEEGAVRYMNSLKIYLKAKGISLDDNHS
jgi:hypothetical protein